MLYVIAFIIVELAIWLWANQSSSPKRRFVNLVITGFTTAFLAGIVWYRFYSLDAASIGNPLFSICVINFMMGAAALAAKHQARTV